MEGAFNARYNCSVEKGERAAMAPPCKFKAGPKKPSSDAAVDNAAAAAEEVEDEAAADAEDDAEVAAAGVAVSLGAPVTKMCISRCLFCRNASPDPALSRMRYSSSSQSLMVWHIHL